MDRPKFYYNIDGVAELGGSVMCVGYALLLWIQIHSSANFVWHRTLFLGFAGLTLVIHYGSEAIKTHITYPRTGFVEYRRRCRGRTATIAGALGALVPVGPIIALRRHRDITTAASLAGLVFAAAYGYQIARPVRWKWAVVWAMTLGSLANDSSAYGTMLLVSGGISFWLYVRQTQAPGREGE